MMTQGIRKLVAELFGTFALVFAGTGAIVINGVSGGTVSHVGIAFTFGLIVLAMIYALGDLSGCHLNPAVTLGAFMARRFEGRFAVQSVVRWTNQGSFDESHTIFGSRPRIAAIRQSVDLPQCFDSRSLRQRLRLPVYSGGWVLLP